MYAWTASGRGMQDGDGGVADGILGIDTESNRIKNVIDFTPATNPQKKKRGQTTPTHQGADYVKQCLKMLFPLDETG